MDQEVASPKVVEKNEHGARGMLVGLICAIVVAVIGIAFGVYGMVTRDNGGDVDGSQNVDDVTTEKTVDAVVAQTIINPYVKPFNYLHNILDYDFSDNAKVVVAFQNMPAYDLESMEETDIIGRYFVTSYEGLNDEFQYLFGNETSLMRADYYAGHTFSISYKTFENGFAGFENGFSGFEIDPFNGGGAGMGMFTIAKDAIRDGDSLNITVYHDTIPVCEADENEGYCMDAVGSGVAYSEDDYNMRDIIENFEEKIPTYTMVFAENAGHLVLKDIKK